jgi:phytanoyl-CoA hydroxylase
MAGFRLSERELKSLKDDGFVLRNAVFSRGECRQIAEAVETLVADLIAAKRSQKHVVGSYMFEIQSEFASVVKWEPDHPDVVQGVEPFAHISKPLNDWGLDPRLVDPCKDLVGADEIALFTEKITTKRAHTGGHIVLHQDFPYWEPMTPIAHQVCTALIYLDDATVENGCLEVVPGSHKEGLPTRKNVEGFGSREIDIDAYDLKRLVPVEAKAGSVVFFGGFLVHRSLPNKSAEDRRALLYSYQPAGHPHGLELNRLLSAKRAQESKATA